MAVSSKSLAAVCVWESVDLRMSASVLKEVHVVTSLAPRLFGEQTNQEISISCKHGLNIAD